MRYYISWCADANRCQEGRWNPLFNTVHAPLFSFSAEMCVISLCACVSMRLQSMSCRQRPPKYQKGLNKNSTGCLWGRFCLFTSWHLLPPPVRTERNDYLSLGSKSLTNFGQSVLRNHPNSKVFEITSQTVLLEMRSLALKLKTENIWCLLLLQNQSEASNPEETHLHLIRLLNECLP